MKRITLEIIIIFFISLLVIFWQFAKVPANLAFDEWEFAKLAFSLDNKPFQLYSTLATGHTTLYFYILLFSLKLFGVSTFALRLPAAVFGVLCPLVFYLLLQEVRPFRGQTSKRSDLFNGALLGAIVFITSRWYFSFARFAFEATFLLLLELSAIYFLLKKNILLTAVFSALAFYSYTPGRIFFLVPLLYLLVNKNKQAIGKFIILFVLLISPLLFIFLKTPDLRISELNLFSSNLTNIQKLQRFGNNVIKTFLMFNFTGDMNGRHNFPGKPALNPILGLFFLIGLTISLLKFTNSPLNRCFEKFDKKVVFLFLVWFLVSLLPSFFIKNAENPNMLRTFTALPAVVFFVLFLKGLTFKRSDLLKVRPLLVILLLLSSVYELRTYFVFQSRVYKNSFQIKCPLPKALTYPSFAKLIKSPCWVEKNEF